jgi:ferric-dicitrate binding protein FerR (iron transport regulator)
MPQHARQPTKQGVAVAGADAFSLNYSKTRSRWFAALCLVVFGAFHPALAQRAPFATLDALGEVSVVRAGRTLPVRPALPLQRGDQVRTHADAYAVIRYAASGRVYLKPNTAVRIGSLFVFSGEVFARVRGFFRIDTDFVNAGVQGTEFTVISERDTGAIVTVREGRVVCSSPSARWIPVLMRGGERLVARRQQQPELSRVAHADVRSDTAWADELDERISRSGAEPPAQPYKER